MKPKQLILINAIFVGLVVLSASTVYSYMTGSKPLQLVLSASTTEPTVQSQGDKCTDKPKANLDNVVSPELAKLKDYQQACDSFVTGTMMTFVGLPTTPGEATVQAGQTATMLKDFAAHGVRPLVIAEPTDYSTGAQIDFADFATGQYTAPLTQYFAILKSLGITDAQMGIWNPFPEANLPYWKNNQPQYFAPNVNLFVATLRQTFPAAQTSIMLNSATYQTTDFQWQNGDYVSLLQYVKGITPGSINYAGLEGFPWMPPAGGNGPILNAAEFLDPRLISEAATSLGTKNIWLNTGTFSKKYALDPSQSVGMSPGVRTQVLDTIDTQAQVLQKQGFNVSVNLFAQNKSQAAEETDWSYWQGHNPAGSLSAVVLANFVHQLYQQRVGLWLFDE